MARPSTIKSIYRCVLRDAYALQTTPQFRLRNALKIEHWGTGYFVPPRLYDSGNGDEPIRIRSLEQYLAAQEHGFRHEDDYESVVDMVRFAFKDNVSLKDRKTISRKLDEAISALQEISNQLILAQCSSVTKTNGVRIEATSQYVPSHSKPQENIFRFTYRITITNENEHFPIQITGRQYTFMSEKGQRIALPRHSPGVVGHTPVLQPGQTFEYASGVDIDSPRGVVVGCLHTIRRHETKDLTEDDTFDAYVSQFHLIATNYEEER